MLKHTKKTREIYEDIQRKLYYMIPEKWEELYLYASMIDRLGNMQTGELFFYYIPKGILRKNPVSVYEVPAKFNLDEAEYLKLVDILYDKLKELREEYRKTEPGILWSNLTISIKNAQFKVRFDYEDLQASEFSSFERHVIWRFKYLGITMERCNREEKEILKRYLNGVRTLGRHEEFEMGIYITNIKNIVDYETQEYDTTKNVEYVATKDSKRGKNQILIGNNQEVEHQIKEPKNYNNYEENKKQSKYIFK